MRMGFPIGIHSFAKNETKRPGLMNRVVLRLSIQRISCASLQLNLWSGSCRRSFGSFLALFRDDWSNGFEAIALFQLNQLHTLGVAARLTDAIYWNADHRATDSDQHNFVVATNR